MEYNQTSGEKLEIMGYKGLNPCSNGIQSNSFSSCSGSDLIVLILVLMEYNQTC